VEVLSVAIPVEILVGVIEGYGLAILGGQGVVPSGGKSLAEGRAVFKREASMTECIAETSPRLAASSLVPLVHENQVVTLERLDRNAHAATALLLNQLGDFDDADDIPPAQPQATLFETETRAGHRGSFHLRDVLFTEPFIGCNEQDVVQGPAVIVKKLPVVEMHDQRLAAAGGHPEGEFGQILRDKGIIHRIARHPPGIPLGDELVELPQQLARTAEIEI